MSSSSYTIHSPVVALINPVHAMYGSHEFMLQYGEASGQSNVENTGTVCAEVYFIFEKDPMCISGSDALDLDAKYSWVPVDSDDRIGPVYYAASIDKYLWLESATVCATSGSCNHWWHIADEVDADTKLATYKSGSWNADPDMTFVTCQDLCIAGNHHTSLDGQYTWEHYNATMLSSVYYCATCQTPSYLFLRLFDMAIGRWWSGD
eukprot:137556_1